MEKRAFVTCINNDRCLPGLYALRRSLQKYRSIYPFIVLVPEICVPLETFLKKEAFDVRRIPDVSVPNLQQKWYWNETFFKLSASSLVEFQKIVLLDSDLLIRGNIDDLLDAPHLSAAMTGRVTYRNIKGFNSGVLVLQPSETYFARLVSLIPPTVKACEERGQYVGDQDVFQASCPDWYMRTELHLHEKYNESPGRCISDFYKAYPREKLLVVHYAGPKKPWDYSFIHFIGVVLIKYVLFGNFRGAHFLARYYWMTKPVLRKLSGMQKEWGNNR